MLIRISLRNLFRQKRRNLLLGMAISIGVMILIVASSFSHGISDTIFNRVVRYVAGQIGVTFNEKSSLFCQIFRDRERMMDLIGGYSKDIIHLEESVGVFCRAVGNKKAESVVVVGVDPKQEISEKLRKEYEQSFQMVEGRFEDLNDPLIENPAILSTDKARDLNVRKNDIIRLRFRNIFGQEQAARITVAGIMKITNIFMSGIIFLELNNLKTLMGYRPWEMGGLNLTVDNPRENAIPLADRIHSALKPNVASIVSKLQSGEKTAQATVLAYWNKEDTKKIILDNITLLDQSPEDFLGKKGVLLTKKLSDFLQAKTGDEIRASYENKLENKTTTVTYKITGIFEPKNCLSDDVMLLNEHLFFYIYYENLPKPPHEFLHAYIPKASDPLYPGLATEWILLPRTQTTDEYQKKIKDFSKKKWRATVVDVNTMYESASDVLKLENALNIITLSAVFILFFIILIGVVNTLRMSIRERTREIGTMRAIGMQKKDVRNVFILETAFLTLFSSGTGVLLAFLVMWGVSKIPIHMEDNPLAMLLVNSRLYFLPTFKGVVQNMALILVIALVTAYFPARRAASLSAAEALRHYE